MSSVYVIDSSARRTTVKVTPGTFVRTILEEACTTRRLNPEKYALKWNHKALDLAQPFRLSGLMPGAKIDLVLASKSPGVVSVALQVEGEGERVVDRFGSNVTLWVLLRKFEDGVAGNAGKMNLTQRGRKVNGRVVYEEPELNVGGRRLQGFEDLQKTLAQLGFNGGSVLVRLRFRTTERALDEVMGDISAYFAGIEGAGGDDGRRETGHEREAALKEEVGLQAGGIQAATPKTSSPQAASPQAASHQAASPQGILPATAPNDVPVDEIKVYRPPPGTTPAAVLQKLPEPEAEPTIDHLRGYQASLKQQGLNKRLPSEPELAERENTRKQKLDSIRSVTVQIRYPDQSRVERNITQSDTPKTLYESVAATLAAGPEEPFELSYYNAKGRKEILPRDSAATLIRSYDFVDRVLVTMSWLGTTSSKIRTGSSLKAHLLAKAEDLKVDLPVEDHQPSHSQIDTPKPAEPTKPHVNAEEKMKKFLGLGRKK
ncbi:hypothetical protein K470DRAFT_283634 [Piedraia hortae CBS 480.64]|uniref:UBX domain-containing protein n=1 Tax=Piedraia hortae CBS 480.64 TaxID=1314780 RepID=A0A6A7BS69_9PEZI|nr:hypothetical protein K470DRAFT_283634 [Piedraia hortae CBS 480.64]